MSCFLECSCRCGDRSVAFDEILARETRLDLTLDRICRSNIGWFMDRSLGDTGLDGWGLGAGCAVYVLWHKDEYCHVHERFHMRALYVGKGALETRLKAHWAAKDLSEQMLVYFSRVGMENRLAKYVEQLLLDTYDFPGNLRENRGRLRLCAHLEQGHVD